MRMTFTRDVPDPTKAAPVSQMDTYDARDLIRDGTSVGLVLDGTAYVLRITRAGKLILTK
ncbi:MAG: hemin uptake protein HemP [Pseudomonadota bacterium]